LDFQIFVERAGLALLLAGGFAIVMVLLGIAVKIWMTLAG
jgi:hypothetical protein